MEVAFNLFDSHDTDRIMNRVKGNINALYQQMALLFTMAGSPCIYYGTEIGMEGGFDPDCRRCMPWNDIDSGKYDDRISFIKDLISIRKKVQAFKNIDVEYLYDFNDSKVLHYVKKDDNNEYHIVINCSKQPVIIKKCNEILISNKMVGDELMGDGVVIYK